MSLCYDAGRFRCHRLTKSDHSRPPVKAWRSAPSAENRNLDEKAVGVRLQHKSSHKAARWWVLGTAVIPCIALGAIRAADPSPGAEVSHGAVRFSVLPDRSSIRFDAQATGHTVHGVTHQVSGEVVFDPDDLARKAEVSFRVQAATLATGNKSRDKKMRESHLETTRHPVIAFRSS